MRKIKYISVILVFIIMGVSGNIVYGARQPQGLNWAALDASSNVVVHGELLVKFKHSTTVVNAAGVDSFAATANAVNSSIGAKMKTRFKNIGWEQVSLPAGMSLKDAAELYKNNPNVEIVEPNYVLRAYATPNDPRYGELWGMERINAPEAWDVTTGSTNVVVAVIDTGIRFTHEDLAGNIWVNPGESGLDGGGNDKRTNGVDDDGNGYIDDWHGWDFVDNDNDPTDEIPIGTHGHGHGSHVAGSIGGVGNNGVGVAGVNWNVRIVPLRFLGTYGGSTADAISAILYAAHLNQYIKLTSNSWGGGGFDQALKDAINFSGDAGQLFVAAAGNGGNDGVGDNNDTIPAYPASYDCSNIISVAAINSGGNLTSFSNFGKTSVDIAAPGFNILSCGIDSDGQYVTMSGTSMATPYVSGVAALLWSLDPNLSWQDIRDAILNNARPNAALIDKVATDGELDAYASFIPVTPDDNYFASGEPSIGPYLPTKTYKINNFSTTAVNWNITAGESWLITPGVITIPALSSTSIVFSIDQSVATTLATGIYTDDISFSNTTTGVGSTTRHVVLKIGNNYKVVSAVYNWIDPVANGHQVLSMSGGRSVAKPIPFNFNCYSNNYSAVYVASGGIAGFTDNGLNTSDNGVIPLPELPNNILAPMWDDLTGGSMYIGTEGIAPLRKLVMSWINVYHANDPSIKYSFQAIINEMPYMIDVNDIIFQYKQVSQDDEPLGGGRSATIGIENDEGLLGRTYSMNGSTLLANKQALLFTMNNVVDTDAPVGKVTVLSHVADSVKFDIRFNEIVEGLELSDLVLSGNAAGAVIDSVSGSGERYVVTVSFGSGLGSVGIGVKASAVIDLAGNPNAAVNQGYYIIPMADTVFSDSMTVSSNDWTVSTGNIGIYMLGGWEWGTPTGMEGPGDGNNCWGTILDGVYSNNMNSWLESPTVHVTDNPIIEFDLWYAIGTDYDFGYVEVNAGLGWENVLPSTNYTGFSSGWHQEQIELDPAKFANKDIKVRFRFTSDESFTYGGMYVRNFSVKSQYDSGVWINSISPTNMAVNSSANITTVAYNMTTTTYHNVTAMLGAVAGVHINGSGKTLYGTMVPGQLVTGTPVVSVTAGAAEEFVTDSVELSHAVSTSEGDWFNNSIVLGITGIAALPTNAITAESLSGVTNWLGNYLLGNGDENSSLVQLIYAGADGTNNPAGLDGSATGDDVILYQKTALSPDGRFGSGAVTADSGKFIVDFIHNLPVGASVFARAWAGNEYVTATAYGDSGLKQIVAGSSQMLDFGSWQVGIPTGCSRDSNGDTVPDGWYVEFGGDPNAAIVPLSPEWTAEAVAGGYGANSGEMAYPEAVAAWLGYVFVADTRNDRIQVWNSDLSTNLWEIGSFGTGTSELNWPAGLVVNETTKQLIVADMGNDRIVVYNIDPINGNLTSAFTFGATGSGSGEFNKPRGVALDAADNIYVADQANNRIQIFDNTGGYLREIGSLSAQPVSVALDSLDKIYVLFSSIATVNVYQNNGTFSASFGGQGSGDGQFSQPADIKIGIGDRIYVVDKSNHRVEILDSLYNYLAEYGVQGVAEGELKYPQGMCIADDGGLYVADTWNHRVQSLGFILDADGDGMDDLWEDSNGLDSSDPNDWAYDHDGDGLSNIGEYRVGTDPQIKDTNGNGIWDGAEVGMCEDPLGPFDGVVINNVWLGGNHSLSWNGDSGAVYDVEMATDLINTNWTVKDTVISGVDGTLGWTNPASLSGPLYYYRVIRK